MKVSYMGKVRKINAVPTSMKEFKRVVQQKFLNCQLRVPDEEQSMAMSRVLDDSEVRGDNSEFANMIDSSIQSRAGMFANEDGRKGRKPKKEKNHIDFAGCVCFYEDSEGDFNVISEDEDLADATTYVLQHN